jgi:NitT/TauT family transport system ATP-binding protein
MYVEIILAEERSLYMTIISDIELDAVAVRYGGFTAVDDISFKVPAGQFVAIVGPTGCGKSSLLNVVAGLVAPAQGRACTAGRVVGSVNRECGYMFQTDA